MTIYVDACAEWGAKGEYKGQHAAQAERVGARHGHLWCHMFSDEADCEELHAFAKKIGLRREWFSLNHYDLVPTKRALAIRHGAVEVDRAQSVAIWKRQRKAGWLVRVEVSQESFSFTVNSQGVVVEADPVARWAVGKRGRAVVVYYRGSGATVTFTKLDSIQETP